MYSRLLSALLRNRLNLRFNHLNFPINQLFFGIDFINCLSNPADLADLHFELADPVFKIFITLRLRLRRNLNKLQRLFHPLELSIQFMLYLIKVDLQLSQILRLLNASHLIFLVVGVDLLLDIIKSLLHKVHFLVIEVHSRQHPILFNLDLGYLREHVVVFFSAVLFNQRNIPPHRFNLIKFDIKLTEVVG